MDHMAFPSQFLWELHFIAAIRHTKHLRNLHLSQFFRELHFIEACDHWSRRRR